MKHSPLIGIMVNRKKNRKKFLESYLRFCGEELKMQLCSFTPDAVSLRKKKVTAIICTGKGLEETVLPLPAAVYNRCYNKTANIFNAVDALIGHKYFNVITHLNKWAIYILLERSALKKFLPDTYLYDAGTLANLLAAWKLLYLKPVYGNKGIEVYRLELTDSGTVLISSHSIAPIHIIRKNEDIEVKLNPILGTKKFIMQKGIYSARVNHCFFDIRVLVQKKIDGNWTVSFVACRVAYDDFFNTSIFKSIYDADVLLSQLINPKASLKLLLKLNDLSIGAAETLDKHLYGLLGELSVDFILDKNEQPWIIEVNGKPQKSIYKGVKNFQHQKLIYQRPLEYALYLSQQPPER